jgi:hypothetical protein
MHPQLLDETLRENRQEPLRLPGNSQPTTDGRAALHEWNAADVTGRNDDRGRDHGDAVAGSRQCDRGMRSAALEQHARSDARNPARVLEPFTRCKRAAQEQKRFVGEFCNLDPLEGYFSLFKRGMKDIYQHCSEKYLHRYLAEFDFRYNNRVAHGVDDYMRAEIAVKGIVGKRLTYRRAKGKSHANRN